MTSMQVAPSKSRRLLDSLHSHFATLRHYFVDFCLGSYATHQLVSDDDLHVCPDFHFSQNTELHALRLTMGKHATSIYALESMLYLTTGIMDKHYNTNIDLETAILKVIEKMRFLN